MTDCTFSLSRIKTHYEESNEGSLRNPVKEKYYGINYKIPLKYLQKDTTANFATTFCKQQNKIKKLQVQVYIQSEFDRYLSFTQKNKKRVKQTYCKPNLYYMYYLHWNDLQNCLF